MAESPLESITRREALGRLGKISVGLAGLALASVPAVTQAFDWTIEELYARSEPAYHVMPGMRYKAGGDGDVVRGHGTVLSEDEWKRYYFDDPKLSPKLQGLFKDLDGQVISHGPLHYTFSFERFNKFMEGNANEILEVRFYEKGFMAFGMRGGNLYSIPVPEQITGTIISM